MLCTTKKSRECRPRGSTLLASSHVYWSFWLHRKLWHSKSDRFVVFFYLFRMQKDSKANMLHTNLSRRYELRCHSFYFSWRQPNLLNTLKRGRVTCRRFTFIPSIHSVIFSICRCFSCYCQLSEPKNMSVYIVHLTTKEKKHQPCCNAWLAGGTS